jgi:shikimate dehydrogenase
MSSRPKPTARTERRRAAVVGSPVAHSLSPVLHLAAYEALGLSGWSYERIERDEAGLAALAGSLDAEWAGLSVTMPGKRAALRVATRATDRAKAVGAANTLVRNDFGEWFADCTDVDGVTGALCAAGGYVPTADAEAVVLGAGGTACASLAALAELDVRRVHVVVRDPARTDEARACAERVGLALDVLRWSDADLAALCESAVILVNTAPPAAVESDVDSLALAGSVLDVIYHPWPTPLAQAVLRRTGRIATGLDMLLHQAFAQVEHFTTMPAPREAMRAALRSATGNTQELPLSAAPSDASENPDPPRLSTSR